MIQFDKLKDLIEKKEWRSIECYLEEIINNEGKSESIQQKWLINYLTEKKEIISMIHKKVHEDETFNQYESTQTQNDQILIKIFSKGLIIPQLNFKQQLQILAFIIQKSTSVKYLLVIFQQSLIEIKDKYQFVYPEHFEKIILKILTLSKCFLNLVGQKVFHDVLTKYEQFYNVFLRVQNEQNVLNESNTQVQQMNIWFFNETIKNISNILFTNQKILSLKSKSKQTSTLFNFLNLLIKYNHQNQTYLTQLMNILNKIICKLQIPIQQFDNIPSIWFNQNLFSLKQIYSQNTLVYLLGSRLIEELPSKPQFYKINYILIPLISEVCSIIYCKQDSIQSFSLKQKNNFYVLLFQRFAILMGLLNKNNQSEKQIQIMINAIFNKKNMFVSIFLYEKLWRQIIQRHQDQNFKTFCLTQYKKVFYYPLNENKTIQILNSVTLLTFKLFNQIQANSNPEQIGYIITFTIFYLSYLRKVQNFYSKSSQKILMIFQFLFSHEKRMSIKNELKQKFLNLRESLKDRLQVSKMKSQTNLNTQKNNNEISICIYRIESEMKFS